MVVTCGAPVSGVLTAVDDFCITGLQVLGPSDLPDSAGIPRAEYLRLDMVKIWRLSLVVCQLGVGRIYLPVV